MNLDVTLTTAEWEAACSIGHKRQWLREHRGRSPAEYRDRGGSHLDRHAVGAVAEYALAKALGDDVLADWRATKAFSLEHHLIPCDVGKNLHVRATSHPRGRLIAHPYDPDAGVFVLARASAPALTVAFVGWCLGSEAKSRERWLDHGPGFSLRPAFVTDADALNPMDTLPPEAVR